MGILSRMIRNKAAPRGAHTGIVAVLKYILPTWIRGDHTLHNSELLFAAVSRIANALSAMPVRLYQNTTPVKSKLADLVGFAPNGWMTSSQFFKTMEACRSTYGNAYAFIGRNLNGMVQWLKVLDPDRVKPVLYEHEDGFQEIFYEIRLDSGVYSFSKEYVLHVPFLSADGYRGINPASVLFGTIDYAESIEHYSREQLDKGINAAVVIDAPANLSEEQQEQAIEAMKEVSKSSGGNILFLESGLKASALNLSPVDTRLFEVEKITRSKVAMVYGIPPHMLGDFTDTSFTSQEQQMLEFLSLTMLPIVTAYEQELTRKLLTADMRAKGQAFRFNMDSILRADAATMADVNTKAIRGGWKTPNEVRAEHNSEPRKEGGKLLASRDLTTLEYIYNNPGGATTGGDAGAGDTGQLTS